MPLSKALQIYSKHLESRSLRFPQSRRVNRQFEQCDVVWQVVRKDGCNDIGCQGGEI